MEINRVIKAVFSPTGGTQKVADVIASVWNREIINIDLTAGDTDFSQYSFGKEELLIAAVPSFGGRVPPTALERITQIKGCGTPTVLVVTYGNREYEDTVIELGDALAAEGCIAIGAVTAVAEHSIARNIAKGRPDEEDMALLKEFAEKIKDKVLNTEEIRMISLPGNRPYKPLGNMNVKPYADKKCDRCGVCAKKCPVGAIPTDEPYKTDEDKCISCMRCIKVCHNNARKINPVVLAVLNGKLKKVCGVRKDADLMI